MKKIFALCFLFLVSCGEEASKPVLSPNGNWDLQIVYGEGDCGITRTNKFSFTVTESAAGLIVNIVDPGTALTGQSTCSPDSCDVSMSLTKYFPDLGATVNMAFNAVMDESKNIQGSGSATLSGVGVSCRQDLTVDGVVQ